MVNIKKLIPFLILPMGVSLMCSVITYGIIAFWLPTIDVENVLGVLFIFLISDATPIISGLLGLILGVLIVREYKPPVVWGIIFSLILGVFFFILSYIIVYLGALSAGLTGGPFFMWNIFFP